MRHSNAARHTSCRGTFGTCTILQNTARSPAFPRVLDPDEAVPKDQHADERRDQAAAAEDDVQDVQRWIVQNPLVHLRANECNVVNSGLDVRCRRAYSARARLQPHGAQQQQQQSVSISTQEDTGSTQNWPRCELTCVNLSTKRAIRSAMAVRRMIFSTAIASCSAEAQQLELGNGKSLQNEFDFRGSCV